MQNWIVKKKKSKQVFQNFGLVGLVTTSQHCTWLCTLVLLCTVVNAMMSVWHKYFFKKGQTNTFFLRPKLYFTTSITVWERKPHQPTIQNLSFYTCPLTQSTALRQWQRSKIQDLNLEFLCKKMRCNFYPIKGCFYNLLTGFIHLRYLKKKKISYFVVNFIFC